MWYGYFRLFSKFCKAYFSVTEHYSKFYKSSGTVTNKLCILFDKVTDKLEPYFNNLSKSNQRRVMMGYLLLIQISLPVLYLAACIYCKRLPRFGHAKEIWQDWKVFKRESYKDLEQWQKENTKLHRALK